MKKEYSGQKISIDLQDADVELVLRLIAEVSKHNLIIDENVKGKISLKLQDIPWDQALDLVLLQKGLGMVVKGNIMRIATTKQLESEREQLRRAREAALQARESLSNLEPLQTRYMQINYSTAAEIEPKVREFLSPRGKISQDARTNMLIIRDAGSQLDKIAAVINKLDRPERQVLIEARIVYATDNFQRSLGINWSGTYNHNDANSRYTRSFNVAGVSLPDSVGGMDAGVSFAKIAGLDLFTLDAQLRLGELKNISKTISSPRVVTLNNNRAEIQQGTKVAYSAESESGGTTTEYEDAILSLSVQPQITPDDKIILDLDISDDSPAGDDISTRSATTKMIVSDNETIVIGGVLKSIDSETNDRVPGLANIPGMGWLFKNESTSYQKEELLIFIRPKILD
jgi:type IV pilus assembly protein PilQ